MYHPSGRTAKTVVLVAVVVRAVAGAGLAAVAGDPAVAGVALAVVAAGADPAVLVAVAVRAVAVAVLAAVAGDPAVAGVALAVRVAVLVVAARRNRPLCTPLLIGEGQG
jgi:hypothetical protein